ncbi:MAG: class I SAM-dependent methyltransferase [Thermoanaerobaculia bacterium]
MDKSLHPGAPAAPSNPQPSSPSSAPPALLTSLNVVDEHFTPGAELDLETYIAAGDLTGIHHLVRYQWAREILRTWSPVTSLLDLGCGSGYGSFLLAQALPAVRVLGIDYDPGAVAGASARFPLPNLSFVAGDPTDWKSTIGDGEFDVITCFDVIEHVKHRELMMEGLVGHLRPGGSLLLSTPCGHAANVLVPGWEHHRIEYAAASLYDFLRRYFGRIERSDEAGFPARHVFEELHARGIEYLLHMNPVICSAPIRLPNPYRQ